MNSLAVWKFTIATASVGLLTALLYGFNIDPHFANVSMLYLLVVTLCAVFLGRSPAIWASILSFFAFDWFFVDPRHTFAVKEPAEWIALCMFLLTATIIGQLMALLRARATEALQHKDETAALAEASWAIASQLDTKSALIEVVRQVAKVVDLQIAAIIATGEDGEAPYTVAIHPEGAGLSTEHATRAKELIEQLKTKETLQSPNNYADDNGSMFLPILTAQGPVGIVMLKLGQGHHLSLQQKHIIDSLVNHSAIILQRHNLMTAQTKALALAQADKLKTALLSMVSHDFRSPLTSIKASVSTLLGAGPPVDPETQKSLLQGIEQETDRINRMVGNILDLSRLEAKAWKLKPELTPIAEILGMALDNFDKDANNRINVFLNPELKEVFADSTQLVQVIKNLVENALKYSPKDSSIEISTDIQDDMAIVEIKDRGRGLPANINNMFEPFWRASELQESSVPGVGIGLAICRGLVEAHGGTILAKNRKDGGASFTVYLPMNTRK